MVFHARRRYLDTEDPTGLSGSTVVATRLRCAVKSESARPVVIYRRYRYIWSRPRRSAIVTACVLSLACSFATRFLTWKLTVVSAMANLSAICLLRYPSRMSLSTSYSRAVRSSSPRCSAKRAATSAGTCRRPACTARITARRSSFGILFNR